MATSNIETLAARVDQLIADLRSGRDLNCTIATEPESNRNATLASFEQARDIYQKKLLEAKAAQGAAPPPSLRHAAHRARRNRD